MKLNMFSRKNKEKTAKRVVRCVVCKCGHKKPNIAAFPPAPNSMKFFLCGKAHKTATVASNLGSVLLLGHGMVQGDS